MNIGIVGGGLMGREVAGAILRWPTLVDHPVEPKLTAVADINPDALSWFDQIGSVTTKVTDYREILADDSIDVVYIAVRHDLHEQFYIDTIRAGKALLAEKPFGIDLAAAQNIVEVIAATPGSFVRCSSEIPFSPGPQWVLKTIKTGRLGRLFKVRASILHSSDLDLEKQINWKRQAKFNGEAGVLNDLGLHVLHLPLRLGWRPSSVYAVLQDLVAERPGPDGRLHRADTFENAEILSWVDHGDYRFPLSIEANRVALGEKNTWSLEVYGLDGGVRFSTKTAPSVQIFEWSDIPGIGREQVWRYAELGSQAVWPTVTGANFNAGFSDSILDMWAAFLAEWAGDLGERFGCVTPDEALESHQIFAAAMKSNEIGAAVEPQFTSATTPITGATVMAG